MLSITQARALHLAAQGLLQEPTRKASRTTLLRSIERMALLQIDTIHVVNRSPYLVLFARLGNYPSVWLEDALAQGQLFETWAHEACFAPRADLLLHRAYNRSARRHWGLTSAVMNRDAQRPHLDKLLAHIRTDGPVKSSDFKRTNTRTSAWWGWKDEKRWLETLFASGELMVARRENFHRVYDLTERVAPEVQGTEANGAPSDVVVQLAWVDKAVSALGITQARWINDYFRTKPRLRDADLDALVDSGVLLRVTVDGWASPAYVHHTHKALLNKAAAGKLLATHTALLSPFDPVVWDRARAATLFNFDYRLECYTPEPKRVHGYFVLPILCCGELIGRLDAKAHRALGVFEVKSLIAQTAMRWTDVQVASVASAIADFAAWHGTPVVQIGKAQPAELVKRLRGALVAHSSGTNRS
jgi:uncharacterized protein YcaQ